VNLARKLPHRVLKIILPVLTVLAATGCAALTKNLDGYPAPASISAGAYPAPTQFSSATVIKHTLVFPLPPETAPPPLSGEASLSGLLFSISTDTQIPDTLFYLTLAVGTDKNQMPPLLAGPIASRGDIANRSLADGSFRMESIPPGNYFLIVSSSINWCEAVVSGADQRPLLISLSPDQRKALGVVAIIWP
jgi:hypothetical protein